MPALIQRSPVKRGADGELTSVATKQAKKMSSVPKAIQNDIKVVCDALAEESFQVEGAPNNKQMLMAMMPVVLSIPRENRNTYQELVLKMLVEVFDTEEQRLRQCVAAAEETVKKIVAEHEDATAEVERAESALQAKSEEVRQREGACAKAEEITVESEAELKKALQEQRDADASEKALATEREEVLEMKRHSFDPLIVGVVENPKEKQQHISSITALFNKRGVDMSLLAGLPMALGKKIEERGQFDTTVANELTDYLAKLLAAMDEDLAVAAAAVKKSAGMVGCEEAVLEVARERKKASDEALSVAQAEQLSLEDCLVKHKKALKDQEKILKKANSELTTIRNNSEHFVDYTKMQFTSLVERTSPADAEQAHSVPEPPPVDA